MKAGSMHIDVIREKVVPIELYIPTWNTHPRRKGRGRDPGWPQSLSRSLSQCIRCNILKDTKRCLCPKNGLGILLFSGSSRLGNRDYIESVHVVLRCEESNCWIEQYTYRLDLPQEHYLNNISCMYQKNTTWTGTLLAPPKLTEDPGHEAVVLADALCMYCHILHDISWDCDVPGRTWVRMTPRHDTWHLATCIISRVRCQHRCQGVTTWPVWPDVPTTMWRMKDEHAGQSHYPWVIYSPVKA